MTKLMDERTVADPGFVGTTVLLSFGEDTWAGEVRASGDPEQIVADLGPGERAVVVLPFSPDEPALAHRVRIVPGGWRRRTGPSPEVIRTHRVSEQPSAATYAIRVADALERIDRGIVEKVVLGRGVSVTSTPPLEADDLIDRMLETRPGRYVFAVPVPGGTLIGASPELLVRRRGTRIESLPLAGSIPRTGDADRDAERATQLQGSAKDLAEHRYVVDQIVNVLSPVAQVSAPEVPELLATDTLWHLATPIVAEQPAPHLTALEIARRLHPTPAMAGVPTTAALDAIAEIEQVSRGPFTGAIGWVDAAGDGEFALTIRAGLLNGETFRLFAGAGIVAGSVPTDEVAETGAKLATLLRIAGVEPANGEAPEGIR